MVKVVLVITSGHGIILYNELALDHTQLSYTEKNYELLLKSCMFSWKCNLKVTWLWQTWLSVVCSRNRNSDMVEIMLIICTMITVVLAITSDHC